MITFAVIAPEHGHIFGQCAGLLQHGAHLKCFYTPDEKRAAWFAQSYPDCPRVTEEQRILEDPAIDLVVTSAIPSWRCNIAIRAMQAGKDVFTDKPALIALDELTRIKQVVWETGRKFTVFYGERLVDDVCTMASHLVKQGAIGRILNVIGLGPHREGSRREDWFYQKQHFGGIITDIGSHQLEQFLHYTGNYHADVADAAVGNFDHPEDPEFEDFGQVTVIGANGATGHHRVDWFTPKGLRTWGDGRLFLLGTDGYMEMRKTVNLGVHRHERNLLLMSDHQGERRIACQGVLPAPFFPALIKDIQERSETAMTQEHIFSAIELCLKAQAKARRLSPEGGRPHPRSGA